MSNEVTTTGPTEIAPSGPLTVEQAYDKRQDAKPKEPEVKPKPEPKPEPAVREADAPDLHSADVESESIIRAGIEAVAALDRQIAAAQQQHAALQEKGEKAQALSLMQDIKNAEKQRAEYQQVVGVEYRELNNRHLARIVKDGEKKLNKAFPDGVDGKALREYLKAGEFTEAEINQAYDYRLVVLAEKARRYDAGLVKARGSKVPKYRKGAKQEQPKENPEYAAAIERANTQGLVKEDASTIVRVPKRQQQQPATVSTLKKRLRETGSVDDAYELLQAQKRQRQSA